MANLYDHNWLTSITPTGFYGYLLQSHSRALEILFGNYSLKYFLEKGGALVLRTWTLKNIQSLKFELLPASIILGRQIHSIIPQPLLRCYKKSVPILMCLFPLYTSHSYTSSLMHRVSCLIQRSAITWSSSRVNTWDTEKVRDNALITVFKAFFEIKVVLKQDSYLAYRVVWGIQNNCFCFGIKFICKFSRI